MALVKRALSSPAMDRLLQPTDPQVASLLQGSSQRFARLVAEAEVKARAFYRRTLGREAGIEEVIDEVFAAVEQDGDAAVMRYSHLFDGATTSESRLVVPREEQEAAWQATDPALQSAMRTAIDQVTAYQRKLLPRGFGEDLSSPLGVRWSALERVGAYVPGGTGGSLPLPSSVIMNLVPARVAGVEQLVLASPPRADGTLAPALLAAAHAVGVDEVWAVGGITAIAALACGTSRLRPVDKIVGPGNIYVTLAKRRAYGRVDIDMLAGPSEVLVIADRSADPRHVAADLLSQAEHDVLAMAVLLALDGCGEAVLHEVQRQLEELPEERRLTAQESLRRFGLAIACSEEQAVALANRIAPEHLELLVGEPRRILPRLRHAGAIFVGPWSPEAIGDYIAGPSHTLPTGGTARMWSGIGADTFLRRTSLINLGKEDFMRLAGAGISLARGEGLEAHARSIESRLSGH